MRDALQCTSNLEACKIDEVILQAAVLPLWCMLWQDLSNACKAVALMNRSCGLWKWLQQLQHQELGPPDVATGRHVRCSRVCMQIN